jgi:hypothetical protein
VAAALSGTAWAQDAVPAKPAAPAAAGEQKFNFDGDRVPDSWKVTGDVAVDKTKNHGEGAGGSLKVAPGATAVLKVAEADSVGKVEFWVFDDGTKPEDPTVARDGPVWGIKAADGAVEAVGVIYATYLSGGDTYAMGMSADGEFLYRDVFYLGINRNKGWHKWTFLFDNDKGLKVLYDDKDVNADNPRIIQDNVKTRGFVWILIAGDTGTGNPQTLWVDDVTVSVAGPLKGSGVPESTVAEAVPVPAGGSYAAWKNGPPKDPNWFALGVWLQDPDRAAEYKAIGINFYIGLWQGPTEEQLAALKKAGMPIVCEQNDVALKHLDDPGIIAWMHMDEPDNAQSDGKGGYGPPLTPEKIVEIYKKIKAADPTRPVYLGLGQGVAWDNWVGRGVRTNKPEDYPEYVKGCDIASFDIYPVVHGNGEIKGKLWKVPYGVERLVQWTGGQKPVWTAMECTRISNPNAKPTPAQVRTEVWMALIHGSRGIVYFVHQFKEAGQFIEAGVLADKEMSEAIAKLNKQILELAPALNSPNVGDGATIASSDKAVPVDAMVKQQGGATYVFAVAMRDGATRADFTVKGLQGTASAEVLGENRKIGVTDGKFSDDFKGYEVHLYKIAGK